MRAARVLDNIEQWISNLCLAALVTVLGMQIVFRYLLGIGLSWSEEVSRFLFIWFVYVSASLAARTGSHVRVTAFVDMLPESWSKAVKVAADIVWIAFNALVVLSGVMLFQRMLKYPVYSTSLMLPLSWLYLVIPVAHAMMIFRILQRLGRWDDPAPAGPEADKARNGETTC